MKRTIGLGILSAAAILGGGTLCAAPQGFDGERPAGGPPPGAHGEMTASCPPMQLPHPAMPDREQLKKAGATEAQIQALSEAGFSQREKQIDLRARAEKAALALERLLSSTNVDEKAVMAAADAQSQAQGELFKLELAAQLQRKQILGDELMRKLHEMRPPERIGDQKPGIAGPLPEGNRQPRGGDLRGGPEAGQRPPPPPQAE